MKLYEQTISKHYLQPFLEDKKQNKKQPPPDQIITTTTSNDNKEGDKTR